MLRSDRDFGQIIGFGLSQGAEFIRPGVSRLDKQETEHPGRGASN